jgi:UDP-glucose:(heptosyl)LPS alpha-1,3-glucosyltransferase
MLIALCLFKYFPYGGLQRDFLAIGKELYKRGHQIRVYTRSWQGDKPSEFDIIEVPVRALTNHSANVKYYEWVKTHLASHPVDKVVGFNRMPGLDFYYDADVCYAEKIEQEQRGFFYRISGRCKHYLEYEKAVFGKGAKTKILLLSRVQQTYFQKHYQTESERFFLLPPGISPSRKYQNAPSGAREKICNELDIPISSFLLLQIGSDFSRKGVDRSIEALASLPEDIRQKTHFIVIGQDNPNNFIKLSKKLKVDTNVHFLLGRNDIPYFIAGCDILLHPARSENTGTVILEALVGGLPEIVSRECGYSQYVNIANTGYVIEKPFSQENYTIKLKQALENKKLETWSRNACFYADNNDLYSLIEKAAKIILADDLEAT